MIARQRRWLNGSISTVDTAVNVSVILVRRSQRKPRYRSVMDWIEDTSHPAHVCGRECAAQHSRIGKESPARA